MSGRLPDTLDGIKRWIDESLGATESRLAGAAEQLRALLSEIELERAQIQLAIEERELDRLLYGDSTPEYELPTSELRQREDTLSQEYAQLLGLHRQMTNFVHLLAASRQQFEAETALPGVSDAQRFAIRQAMIRAQEDERRRLAREIHDGPAQVLANAIIGLEFIGRSLQQTAPEEEQHVVGEIERVKTTMREGLTEIRRFIFDLRPTMLSQRGLAGTVAHYIETYQHFFSTEIETDLPERLPKLTPDQELTAFRVLQEALHNAQRHARAKKVKVTMRATPESLVIQVSDDGQGFRPSAVVSSATGGFGLTGMRERAEVIGGRLTVRSAPGMGTEVTLQVPLTNHDHELDEAMHEETRGVYTQAKGEW